ncbi:MAG: hypothetical protein M0Z64_05435 [Nitrospiraceae bacterium]|nr:hypothetical protein [Nitrospiraceae bacterium]
MDDSLYIKRLKERLRQKPASKVFLSLAEELRKKDRMDEAIAVLVNGIKKNPDFIAARLTLGRWYFLSNMIAEAQKEFSEVIKRSPDNIFAGKWLAEVKKGADVFDNTASDFQAKDRDVIANRLNKFMEGIKSHFDQTASLHRNRDAVVNRLEKFLETIKIRFAASSENPL